MKELIELTDGATLEEIVIVLQEQIKNTKKEIDTLEKMIESLSELC